MNTFSKEEILEKYLNDNHGAGQTCMDIIKAMEEYAELKAIEFAEWPRENNYEQIVDEQSVNMGLWRQVNPNRFTQKYLTTSMLYQLSINQSK